MATTSWDISSPDDTHKQASYAALYQEVMTVCNKYDDDTMHDLLVNLVAQRVAQIANSDDKTEILRVLDEVQLQIRESSFLYIDDTPKST